MHERVFFLWHLFYGWGPIEKLFNLIFIFLMDYNKPKSLYKDRNELLDYLRKIDRKNQ